MSRGFVRMVGITSPIRSATIGVTEPLPPAKPRAMTEDEIVELPARDIPARLATIFAEREAVKVVLTP
jgi:hypothetical protein